jgi:hypothetical protein
MTKGPEEYICRLCKQNDIINRGVHLESTHESVIEDFFEENKK